MSAARPRPESPDAYAGAQVSAPGAPEVAAAPLERLGGRPTPAHAHFRRNHYAYPQLDAGTFRLMLDGAVRRPLMLSLDDLRRRPARTIEVTLECAGHRRTELDPPPPGTPWAEGAVSHAEWTGVPLRLLLDEAGLDADAVEIAFEGADCGAFEGVEGKHSFARGLALGKALHPDTLVAYAMNGEALPVEHGAPLRLVVPGWYAMASVKWLVRISALTAAFEGVYQALDYRMQLAGETGPGRPLTEMPVTSLITSSVDGATFAPGWQTLGGIAWGGRDGIARVEVRIDDGPWLEAGLEPAGPYAPVRWSATWRALAGAHRLSCRATDGEGHVQPDAPTWNVRGYGNNAVHAIDVDVA
jgi:DMSO/TMAO reductase YedYZ molybdopterin-dependent catalytic subunit